MRMNMTVNACTEIWAARRRCTIESSIGAYPMYSLAFRCAWQSRGHHPSHHQRHSRTSGASLAMRRYHKNFSTTCDRAGLSTGTTLLAINATFVLFTSIVHGSGEQRYSCIRRMQQGVHTAGRLDISLLNMSSIINSLTTFASFCSFS